MAATSAIMCVWGGACVCVCACVCVDVCACGSVAVSANMSVSGRCGSAGVIAIVARVLGGGGGGLFTIGIAGGEDRPDACVPLCRRSLTCAVVRCVVCQMVAKLKEIVKRGGDADG